MNECSKRDICQRRSSYFALTAFDSGRQTATNTRSIAVIVVAVAVALAVLRNAQSAYPRSKVVLHASLKCTRRFDSAAIVVAHALRVVGAETWSGPLALCVPLLFHVIYIQYMLWLADVVVGVRPSSRACRRCTSGGGELRVWPDGGCSAFRALLART